MAERDPSLSSVKWFGLVIAVITITDIVIPLNIPILRQIFGLIFLIFIPGFLLVTVLKLNRLGLAEKIVLSVGLSVAFSILFGLLINSLLPALGYTTPLSTASLLISFSIANIILAIIAYIRNRDVTLSFSNFKMTAREKAFLVVPALFPLLSIIGIRIMNLTNSNVILMLLLFMIPAYVIFISISNRSVPEKVYPIAIFLISISLLLMYSLRSNHVIDSDTHLELVLFLSTLENSHWSQLGFGILDACLSISLLPAVYQTFINIGPEFLYKILYSLICSILPLTVYLPSKKYIGSFYAFLASVFFMSQIVFLWTPSYARSNMAILFFGLAVLVIFHDGISEFGKRVLFIIFTTSVILSHYSVTYVTFFVLLFTWIGMEILLKIISRIKGVATPPIEDTVIEGGLANSRSQGGPSPESGTIVDRAATLKRPQTQLKRGITFVLVALFLVVLFFWHSEMTGPSFHTGIRFIYRTFTNWQWFLAEGVGEEVVQTSMGKTLAYTGVPQKIEFVFSWLTIVLITIGLFFTIRKFKTMVSNSNTGYEKPNFMLKKFDAEFVVMSAVCFSLLGASVVLPLIAGGYGIGRIYFQMMIPLSIFLVIGGIMAAKYLKLRPYWLILAVLIPYFLSTTGVMCQVFSFPRAITLNSEGPLYDSMYISDGESNAAKWVKEYAEQGVTIYASGLRGYNILFSQGRIPAYDMPGSRLSTFKEDKEIDGYIYLRYLDVVDSGTVTKYPVVFTGKNKIYANSRAEVYK